MKLPSPKTLLWMSATAAVLTIILKTLAWYVTGSVGLLSDAMESFVNLAGAVFALMMVTIAERPADEDHPHGHHKAEYFSSGFEGMLIFGAALGILWTSINRLMHPQPLEQLGWGMAFSMASTVLNGIGAWVLLKAANVHNSIALEADGRHLRTDVWTSIGVIVGVALVQVTGWLWLDPVVAIAVALNILKEGWHLIRNSSHGLMDSVVDADIAGSIQQTLDRFVLQEKDPQGRELVRFDHVVTRAAGQRSFVSMHMHMPASWTLGRSAQLRNDVERALVESQPQLHATIEMLPSDVEPLQTLGDLESVAETAPASTAATIG